MLRSWIDRLHARFDLQQRVGLAIGRRRVGLACVRQATHGLEVETVAEVELASPLFAGKPTPDAVAALNTALAALAAEIAGQYVPVHVSLPDAAVRLAVFELEALPGARSEQQELARWRLQQEVGAGRIACVSQSLGPDCERQLLLGLAIDADWQDAIATALAQAGIVAWSLSANICRQFNRFHDRLTTDSGALVCVADDSWALLLWDAAGRVRYARSRWRSGVDDHAELAAEIERSIVAYAHGAANRSVAHVYMVGDGALPAALDGRLREPCVRLAVQDSVTIPAGIDLAQASVPGALAAALER